MDGLPGALWRRSRVVDDLNDFTQLAAATGFYNGEVPNLNVAHLTGVKMVDFTHFLKADSNDKGFHKMYYKTEDRNHMEPVLQPSTNQVYGNEVALLNGSDADACRHILGYGMQGFGDR
jgi:hypothetical protein